MLDQVNKDIFLNSSSIKLLPKVSAEWNQNIFNPPYATIAGSGVIQTNLSTSANISPVNGAIGKSGFNTKSFIMTANENTITYNVTPSSSSAAFKIITYVKTDSNIPIIMNFSANGTKSQFGSNNEEVNSFGYMKVETYIGGCASTDIISSFTYTITLNRLSTDDPYPTIYFTEPEIYPVSLFDYKYNSTWPTDSVFTNFRPAESYVNTGNAAFNFPSNFRRIKTKILNNETNNNGFYGNKYMPVSPIIKSPGFFNVNPPVAIYKNGLANDLNPYKYFVSDTSNKSITALYKKSGILTNKLVLKFNNLAKVPIINIYINGSLIQVDGSTSIDLSAGGPSEDAGVLVLYWNGTSWTRTKWNTMPQFTNTGSISLSTSLSKITVTEINKTIRPEFSSYASQQHSLDMDRLQIVEVSPRLEIDLTDYLINFSVNKSLDSKDTYMPISGINADDVSITLSAIPLGTIDSITPIFSNQSNYSNSVLKNMLRKNIKFYTNFYLDSYIDSNNSNVISNTIIPGGVFYSDSWSETDINEITIQAYDIGRYLQSTPAADYVANLKTVFDIVSNLLDLSGFTDYDYDSLYEVCNDKSVPLDIAYYYVNSKDTTLIDALNQLFLPYQIGVYINEYGIMKFLSLSKILSNTSTNMDYTQNNVLENGYSVVNKAKPGKISLRYQSPKIKQSLALQNATVPDITNGPSFIYTTSNDVVWSQQNADSVGFNYLQETLSETASKFKLNVSDLLDIFHTYSLNNNGYAFIENEIVSFVYKEYMLASQSNQQYVNVKNDIELAAEINKFTKKYQVGLVTSDGTSKTDYNIVITPTGNITNVQRGVFGTRRSSHTVLTSGNFAIKGISASNLINNTISGSASTSINYGQIQITPPSSGKTLIYPTSERSVVKTDINPNPDSYKTYSGKFNFVDGLQLTSGGIFFNFDNSLSSANGAYFVELIRTNTKNDSTGTWNSPAVYNYYLAVYNVSGGVSTLISYTDITNTVNNIILNFEKVLIVSGSGDTKTYSKDPNPAYQTFNLRVSSFYSDGTDGEDIGNHFSIFLNNREISGWQVYRNSKWLPPETNTRTGLFKKLSYSGSINVGTVFGTFMSNNPIAIPGITYPTQSSALSGGIREVHATYKPLRERSVNYYFQDREFLNGMIQNQNIYNNSPTYIMQTTPEVIGINTYDVQYTTPAAVSVDVLPIEYLWAYFPGRDIVDQKYIQFKEVDEYSLSYSTPLNTGFRAKLAVANNSNHMVYLKKDSDDLNQFTIYFNLWTHQIIASADPEIIEKVIDSGNYFETVQLDSNWIQSKESANKLINMVAKNIDNFSKDVSLDIFGNPLIQVGDVIGLTYNLTGLNQQKYIVHSVSHSFDNGLTTKLTLNMIDSGVNY